MVYFHMQILPCAALNEKYCTQAPHRLFAFMTSFYTGRDFCEPSLAANPKLHVCTFACKTLFELTQLYLRLSRSIRGEIPRWGNRGSLITRIWQAARPFVTKMPQMKWTGEITWERGLKSSTCSLNTGSMSSRCYTAEKWRASSWHDFTYKSCKSKNTGECWIGC